MQSTSRSASTLATSTSTVARLRRVFDPDANMDDGNKENTPATAARHQQPASQPSSRPSSPVKKSASRPSSRPASPLKRTPVPGKNEHFETIPNGFVYRVELPESKIVPKKEGGTRPSKSKISTPVKSATPAKHGESGSKSIGRRTESPTKSISESPSKDVLKMHVATPTNECASSAKPALSLTKTHRAHGGTPTVELSKTDVCVLRSSLNESGYDVDTMKQSTASTGERGPSVNATSAPHVATDSQKEHLAKSPRVDGPRRKLSVPTNFGEMLRNSSQDVLQSHATSDTGTDDKKQFASPTVLDKVRRKSEVKNVAFLRPASKPHLNGMPKREDGKSSVSRDFAGVKENGVINGNTPEGRATAGESYHPRASAAGGTPPALLAAMEADMSDIRISWRRSMGNSYVDSPRSPNPTGWLGSSTPRATPPGSALSSVGNTPRINLHRRMAAARKISSGKDSTPSKRATASPLMLQMKEKTGATGQSPLPSRLPRFSPTKKKPQPKSPGTVPHAARTSVFDAPPAALLTPSRVPAMASRRAHYARASQDEGEIVGFASAEDIAKQVSEWNSQSNLTIRPRTKSPTKPVTKTPAKIPTTPLSVPTFMRPTATSASKEKTSYTPPGLPTKLAPPADSPTKARMSPSKNRRTPPKKTLPFARKAFAPARPPLSPLKNPKVRALVTPRTPLPRSTANRENTPDQGALRTPSREMVSKLDREIDAHLEGEAKAGRVFTPSGQRISDLFAAKRRSEGVGGDSE